MCQADVTPRFDQSIVFPDIDAATLARENEKSASVPDTTGGAWQTYLRKVLPPGSLTRTHSAMRVVQF